MFNEDGPKDPFDNDGDGYAYCLDEDCFSPACEEVCGDVYDNDGDARTDCADIDFENCENEDVPSGVLCASGEPVEQDCNDGDGYIDCPDDRFFNYDDDPAPSPAPLCEQFTIKCQQVVGSLCSTGLPTEGVSTFDDHDNDTPSCKLSDDDECKTP